MGECMDSDTNRLLVPYDETRHKLVLRVFD